MPPTLANAGKNCWNTGSCERPQDKCYVHFKTAAAGLAQCRESCPGGWLCERRVPDGNGAACGPAPLELAKLVQPTDAMHALLASSPWGGLVKLCDRASPPRGAAIFEITCFDGGQTGNRYSMVKTALQRAACCGGVALLPPEFDHFPQSGASCFDFRGLRRAHTRLLSPPPPPSPLSEESAPPLVADPIPSDVMLAPAVSQACAANLSASSKRWWGPLMHETAAHCPDSAGMGALLRLCASLYAGFAVPGLVFRDMQCAAATRIGVGGIGEGAVVGKGSGGGGEGELRLQSPPPLRHHAPRTLTMHVRSGDIFSNWRDGKHLTTHGGFQHDPYARGQPPLAFYVAAATHSLRHEANGTSLPVMIADDEEDAEAAAAAADLSPIAGAHSTGVSYQAAVLATSPDRSNPVAHALLERVNGTALSMPLQMPLSLASSESFQDDLAQLLCARHLALALSSLNTMLLDSPNLRDAYVFQPDGCSPPPPPLVTGDCQPDDAHPANRMHAGGTAGAHATRAWVDPASRVRSWCIAPQPSAGRYTVAQRWEHTDAQVREMLSYAHDGRMNAPMQQGGRRSCAK